MYNAYVFNADKLVSVKAYNVKNHADLIPATFTPRGSGSIGLCFVVQTRPPRKCLLGAVPASAK